MTPGAHASPPAVGQVMMIEGVPHVIVKVWEALTESGKERLCYGVKVERVKPDHHDAS